MTINSAVTNNTKQTSAGSPLKKSGSVSAAGKTTSYRRTAEEATGIISDISGNIRAKIAWIDRQARNSQTALAFLQTADGALSGIREALSEGRRIALQIAEGGSAEGLSLDGVLNSIDELSKTKFGDNYIFSANPLQNGESAYTEAPGISADEQPSFWGLNTLTRDEDGNSVLTMFNDSGEASTFTIGFNDGSWVTNSDHNIESGGGTTSLDANLSRISGMTAAKKTALTALAGRLDTEYVPKILSGIVAALPQTINGVSGDGTYKIGLNFYTDSSNTLAYVAASYPGTPPADGGSQPMTLQLSINIGHLSFSGSSVTSDSEQALLGTIAHELTHAVMDVATSNGMTSQSDRFPHWFTEGVAEVFGGGMDRLTEYLPVDTGSITVNNADGAPQSTIDYFKNSIASGQKTDYSDFLKAMRSYNTSSQSLIGYSRGYVAAMYLGWMANGGGAVTDSRIAHGIDVILSRIQGGESLSGVINDISGGKYTSASDFQSKMGDDDSSEFMRKLVTETGVKSTANLTITKSGGNYHGSWSVHADGGSVIAGGLNRPTANVYNSGRTGSNFIDLVTTNSQVLNTNNVLEGGSATKDSSGNTGGGSGGGGGGGGGSGGGGGTGGGGGSGGGFGGIGGGSASGSAYRYPVKTGRPCGVVLQMGVRSKDAIAMKFNYGGTVSSGTSSIDISSKGLGVRSLSISSAEDARAAVDAFDRAIGEIDSLRESFSMLRERVTSSVERNVLTEDETDTRNTVSIIDFTVADTKLMLMDSAADAISAQANVDPNDAVQVTA